DGNNEKSSNECEEGERTNDTRKRVREFLLFRRSRLLLNFRRKRRGHEYLTFWAHSVAMTLLAASPCSGVGSSTFSKISGSGRLSKASSESLPASASSVKRAGIAPPRAYCSEPSSEVSQSTHRRAAFGCGEEMVTGCA